jgi:sugar phosphate isomerase/epimerase
VGAAANQSTDQIYDANGDMLLMTGGAWRRGRRRIDPDFPHVYPPAMKFLVPAALAIVLSSSLIAADRAAGTGPSFKGPLGLQMYSLRFYSPDNLLAKLDKVQEYGLKTIEGGAPARGMSVEQFFTELDKRGIKLVSTGVDYARLKSNPDAAVEQARKLGVKYVMCAWIPHDKGGFTEKNAREAIEVFNTAGPKFKKAGIIFTYHCHGYEFQPLGDGTLFDLIVKETRPDSVFFELDVFWAQQGGANPAKLLEKYRSRFKLMHVKDLKRGAAKNFTGGAPDEESVPVGQGEVDWKAVLKAAEQAHVEYYFIEDEARNAADQIPETLQYLEKLRW